MTCRIVPLLNLRQDGATSTLLIFQDVSILLDCGWADNSHLQRYDRFEPLLTNVDLILLSRSDSAYSGAFPYFCTKFKFKGKVFSTIPVKYLSSIGFKNLSMKRFPKEQFDREAAKKYFSRVFEIYDSIIDIGYKQKRTLRIKDRNVRLVAFQCGNSIGAAFWRIGIGSYTIGYLSEYNHMDELHLGGFQPTQFQFKHFSLLITSSYNSLTKKMLVKDFTSKISRILTDNETTGTSVIFTTKSFARIFEYILQIEFVLMERKNAENYKFFIPETLDKYLEVMRSLSEFMSHSVLDNIYEDEKSFLTFKYCKTVTPAELNKYDASTKIIFLCQENDLLFGPYSQYFESFMKINKKNTLYFIEKYPEGFANDARNILRQPSLPKDFIERMIADEDTDLTEEQLKPAAGMLTEDDNSTLPGSLIETKQITNTADDEEFGEKEVLFAIGNGFFQFAAEDLNKAKSEYGIAIDEHVLAELKQSNQLHMTSNYGPKAISLPTQDFDCYNDIFPFGLQPPETKISCRCGTATYQGLSEGYSIDLILKQLKFDKVSLINGSEEETDHVRSMLSKDRVLDHYSGQEITLSSNVMNALAIPSHTSIVSNPLGIYNGELKISHFKAEVVDYHNKIFHFKPSGNEDLEYVHVRGVIRLKKNSKLDRIDYSSVVFEEEEHLPGQERGSVVANPEYSSLKQFKLLQFKDLLEKKGYSPTLECGRLNVADKTYVKQIDGKLTIEGVFSPEYFKVRALLYEYFLN